MNNTRGMITMHSRAARLLAVEVLLAEPGRDRLQGKDTGDE
jgi:hypothetical protein